MTVINLAHIRYIVRNSIIYVSEVHTTFDTAYNVISPKTGVTKTFTFECSTGPEFDPKTEWIYKSAEGYKLHICNDANITELRAQSYLKHKLNK
jgi:hypothetical protein